MGETNHRQIHTSSPPNWVPGCEYHSQEWREKRGPGKASLVRTLSSENQAMSRHEPGKNGRERHSLRREQHGQTVEGGRASWRMRESRGERTGGKLGSSTWTVPLLPLSPGGPALACPPGRNTVSLAPPQFPAPCQPWPAASSHSPADPASLHEGLPSPPPAQGGTKPSMGGGWGRWVPSGITSPPGTPLKLSKSLHPKPPHPSAVTPCCLLSALSSALSTSSFLLLSPLPEGHPTP